jgi:hypothetical protein
MSSETCQNKGTYTIHSYLIYRLICVVLFEHITILCIVFLTILCIVFVHSFKKHRTLTLIGEHRTKFILLLNNILNCSSLTHNRSEIWPPYCPFKFKFMGIAFWFTYSSTVWILTVFWRELPLRLPLIFCLTASEIHEVWYLTRTSLII